MAENRLERDSLGELAVPADALWGIHTARALGNFPLTGRPVRRELVHAYGQVKHACVKTMSELSLLEAEKVEPIARATVEMSGGVLDEWVVVDALQGGAGTSTNMNVNEVLANRALQLLGKPLGAYEMIDPLDDVNRYQSTNDTYPTALKVAAMLALQGLEQRLVALLEGFQAKEKAFASIVKLGRTQCQDAVLVTLGREMGAYADAIARDRWRVFKCQERLRVVNLGGTAVGTGLAAPRPFIFRVTEALRELTGLGLARAENLMDPTQNADVYVEVSGIFKALASTLMKISSDLRFLSSGPSGGIGELKLPPRQAGSSIMPGKVNPVIPEAVTQVAMVVFGHDQVISQAAGMGHLELNPFLPVIAESLLETITLLSGAADSLQRHVIDGLEADEQQCRAHVENGTAAATSLVDQLGYQTAARLAGRAAKEGRSIRELLIDQGVMTGDAFDAAITPEAVTRLGSRPRNN